MVVAALPACLPAWKFTAEGSFNDQLPAAAGLITYAVSPTILSSRLLLHLCCTRTRRKPPLHTTALLLFEEKRCCVVCWCDPP